jgi:cell division protein FtsA
VVAVSDPEGEISPSDTQRVIEAASAVSLPSSRELVHVIPREFKLDGEAGVKDPIGMSGVRLEVETHLITASVPALKNLRKAIEEVGVDIDGFVFSGLAASKAVLTKTEKELGCVLVDIGGGTTSIVTYIDGEIAMSQVIPVGAKNVTNDIAIGLRVSLDAAEKIKRMLSDEEKKKDKKKARAGSEADKLDLTSMGIKDTKRISKKTLTEGIIRPRLNEIFTVVRIQLEKENLKSRVPSGIIITGGGADTVGIESSAKRMLSLPVRIGNPKGVGGLIDDIMNPAFATPIGLILHGAQEETGSNMGGFTRRVRLSTQGSVGKIVDAIKDLLP